MSQVETTSDDFIKFRYHGSVSVNTTVVRVYRKEQPYDRWQPPQQTTFFQFIPPVNGFVQLLWQLLLCLQVT